MEIVGFQRSGLLDYLVRQLEHFFPDGEGAQARTTVDRALDDALQRSRVAIDAAVMWRPGRFDPLHSEQNTLFLYFLANTIHRMDGDRRVATKVFYLNKALNAFSCFYDTELPDIWFVGHSPGIVLARAEYGSHFCVYQGCTVGKNHGRGPVLGKGVLMYPGSSILGGCKIGDRTVVAQGQRVVEHDTPGDCYVFSHGPELVLKPMKRPDLDDIFRH